MLARYLHAKSKRSSRPFISVNCAALPEHLLESELFGHEKKPSPAPWPAASVSSRKPPAAPCCWTKSPRWTAAWAKLLRAVQEREIDRVGEGQAGQDRHPHPGHLEPRPRSPEAVKDGTFREDLLCRLNVVNLRLPPLRERPGDVLALAEHFAKKYAIANGSPGPADLGPGPPACLAMHRWPGNVRELENAMHRAVLLSSGPEVEEFAIRLPDGAPMTSAPGSETARVASMAAEAVSRNFVGQTVAAMEQQLIIDTLGHCLGNRTHAATILGISIRTLRNKLKEYSDAGISVPPPQPGPRRARPSVEVRSRGQCWHDAK